MTPLEIAKTQIGITEYPPNSNRTKYGEWYGLNGVAWCVIFQQWNYAEAATPLPFKTASCTELLNWYRKNDPGCIVKTPKPNDLAIICFGKGRYHIGIVEKDIGDSIITIEGNTSDSGSQDNGGAVLRKTRSKSLITAYIRPRIMNLGGGSTLDIVKGSTTNEDKMIRGIQLAVGSVADGEIGTQTLSDIACLLDADCFPLTLKIYGVPVIITKDIVPFSAGGAKLSDYKNTINGSFYANKRPCSILIQDGIVVRDSSCHIEYDKPESVIYKTVSGEIGIKRVKTVSELPKSVIWAVGGCGLLDFYNPTEEGFCVCTKNGKTENFSDVIKTNNHSMLGIKNNHIYLVYCTNMDGAGVNAFAKKLGLEKAILLDGGHVAGINGTEDFAKINTKSTSQYYMIQGVDIP